MLRGNEMNLNKIFERMGEKIIAKTQTKNKMKFSCHKGITIYAKYYFSIEKHLS